MSLVRRKKMTAASASDTPDGLASFIALIRSMPVMLSFQQIGELLGLDPSTVRRRKAGTKSLTHIPMGDADSKRTEYRVPRDEVERLVVERYLAARAPFDRALGQVFDFEDGRSRRRATFDDAQGTL